MVSRVVRDAGSMSLVSNGYSTQWTYALVVRFSSPCASESHQVRVCVVVKT